MREMTDDSEGQKARKREKEKIARAVCSPGPIEASRSFTGFQRRRSCSALHSTACHMKMRPPPRDDSFRVIPRSSCRFGCLWNGLLLTSDYLGPFLLPILHLWSTENDRGSTSRIWQLLPGTIQSIHHSTHCLKLNSHSKGFLKSHLNNINFLAPLKDLPRVFLCVVKSSQVRQRLELVHRHR